MAHLHEDSGDALDLPLPGWIAPRCKADPKLKNVTWMLEPLVSSLQSFCTSEKMLLTPTESPSRRHAKTLQETFDLVLLDLLSLLCIVGNPILDVYLGRVYNVLCRLRFERDSDHPWEAPVAQPPIECAALLRFHVHLTKSRLYALKVTWPATSATWTIRRSFSHFSNLRRDLTAIFHQLQLPLFQLRRILPTAVDSSLSVGSTVAEDIVASFSSSRAYRQDAFSNLVEHLMHVRWLCYQCHDPGHPALDDAFALVLALLDSFLEVPSTIPRRSPSMVVNEIDNPIHVDRAPAVHSDATKQVEVCHWPKQPDVVSCLAHRPSCHRARSLSFCFEYLNIMSAIHVIAHDEAPHYAV
ncbi:hypothetical protein AC1031_015254 [Aphanomyces cochlioides]|nr:hypothetical protein AC1031_015254 [Aphanomyces cochlioides]